MFRVVRDGRYFSSTRHYEPIRLDLICTNKIFLELLEKTKVEFTSEIHAPCHAAQRDLRQLKFGILFCHFAKSINMLPRNCVDTLHKIFNQFMLLMLRTPQHWAVGIPVFLERAWYDLHAITIRCPPSYGYTSILIADMGRQRYCTLHIHRPITVGELKRIYLAPGKRSSPGFNHIPWALGDQKWQLKLKHRRPRVFMWLEETELADSIVIDSLIRVRIYCNFKKRWY